MGNTRHLSSGPSVGDFLICSNRWEGAGRELKCPVVVAMFDVFQNDLVLKRSV